VRTALPAAAALPEVLAPPPAVVVFRLRVEETSAVMVGK